jgi:signal transduction histidine kinase
VTVRVVVDPRSSIPRRIDVIDTGVGIPKDMQEKIFEAFQQVDSGMSRKYEGTGLGLTISRSLCELLGCRIEVGSEIGKGSDVQGPSSARASPRTGHDDAAPPLRERWSCLTHGTRSLRDRSCW